MWSLPRRGLPESDKDGSAANGKYSANRKEKKTSNNGFYQGFILDIYNYFVIVGECFCFHGSPVAH